jgi:hypothetical protein
LSASHQFLLAFESQGPFSKYKAPLAAQSDDDLRIFFFNAVRQAESRALSGSLEAVVTATKKQLAYFANVAMSPIAAPDILGYGAANKTWAVAFHAMAKRRGASLMAISNKAMGECKTTPDI